MELVFTKEVNGTTIMVYLTGESKEVYYRRPGYPFKYAFSLSSEERTRTVFQVAEDNMENYEDLFDEEDEK